MGFVRGVYAVAIGVLIVFLVIYGIAAFYPGDAIGVYTIVLPLGAALAVAGAFVRGMQSVLGAGLILGGVGIMIFAITPFRLDDLWRFVGIAVTLAVLVFVGLKVFRRSEQD